MSYAVRDRPFTKATILAEQVTGNGYAVIDDYVASNDLKRLKRSFQALLRTTVNSMSASLGRTIWAECS